MRILRHFLLTIAAIVFLFEAWLWDILTAFWLWLAGLLPVDRIKQAMETQVRRLPPYAALALFIIPALVVLPFKFFGLWLIARGSIILGGATFFAAKISSMGIAAFLFELTRPKLLTLAWFLRLYNLVIRARDWAHALADPYIQPIKAELKRLKVALAGKRAGLLRIAARLRARIKHRHSAK